MSTTTSVEREVYGQMVVIVDDMPSVPVFHRTGTTGAHKLVTACGRTWRTYKKQGDGYWTITSITGILLRTEHALKFARPCQRCYRAGILERLPEHDRQALTALTQTGIKAEAVGKVLGALLRKASI